MPLVQVRYCPSTQRPIKLWYDSFGDETKELVLLVMGLNCQGMCYDDDFCNAMASAGPGFRVVRYDNRDVGLSTKCDGCPAPSLLRLAIRNDHYSFGERLPYTLDDMALDAFGLVDALGAPGAHVFGVSMGGMIAQLMALHAPRRVYSLTSVMSSTGARDLPDPPLSSKVEFIRPPRDGSREALIDHKVHFITKLLAKDMPLDVQKLEPQLAALVDRSPYRAGLPRQLFAIVRAPPRDDGLRHLTGVPATVIHGALDVVVPPEHGKRTADAIPGAKWKLCHRMAHFVHPDDYAMYAEEMAEVYERSVAIRRERASA